MCYSVRIGVVAVVHIYICVYLLTNRIEALLGGARGGGWGGGGSPEEVG